MILDKAILRSLGSLRMMSPDFGPDFRISFKVLMGDFIMTCRRLLLFSFILLTFPVCAKADDNLVELVKKTKPAVVLIQTFDDVNQPVGQGSGFFINNKGHIVTNHHVLEGASRATIKTSSGNEYPVEGVIDKNADADIVKIIANIPDANISFLNLSEVVPSEGQDIFVIGNPLGLESSVSSGIVSAVRDIPAFGKIIQITAPISPGSSGSPVINNKGEVIGIATLIATKGQNLNFAIPSDKIIALKETSSNSVLSALASDSNDALLFYIKGLKELWQENWLAALTCFQKTLEKNPKDSYAWCHLGYCYVELGLYKDAIEAYKQAIRIEPNLAEAHYNLGNAYDKLGLNQDAIEGYKQAIRINPNYALAHHSLGFAYVQLGFYLEAVEAYNQALRINPDNDVAYSSIGYAYYKLGHYQEAIEASKQAIKIKPDDAGEHFSLGSYYFFAGNKRSALEEYKILKTLDNDLANKLFNLIYK